MSLKTLHRVAEALDCQLIYALVPKTSLQKTVDDRAKEVAAELVSRVNHTMRLEKQGLSADERQAQIDDLADELVRTDTRSLWRRTP